MIKSLLLSATSIATTTMVSVVAPAQGADEYTKTDVAAQKETTNETKNENNNMLHAGITAEVDKYISEIYCKIAVEENENDIVSESEVEYTVGYTTDNVNVRISPDINSDVLEVYRFNYEIEYAYYNEEWVEILYEDSIAYIYSDYISNEKCEYIEYSMPSNSGFKSYMPYTSITSPSSNQYKLQKYCAYTGNYGIRMVNGRYCVAIGTAFNTSVGTYFDLVLENGTEIPCIVGDIKAETDTESNNIVTAHNGCVSEFIVDLNALNSSAKRDGDISSCCEEWNSPVVAIKIYDINILN
jgi:hypothetical protein